MIHIKIYILLMAALSYIIKKMHIISGNQAKEGIFSWQ